MNKQMNWIKRGAVAAVMAGLMGFAPVAANAATITEGQATQPITKNWTVASQTQWSGNQEFTFKLTYVDATAINGNATAKPTLIDENNGTVSVKTGESASLTHTGSTTLAALVSQYDFTKPGQYFFTLSEVPGDNANIVWDETDYQVRVDVVWADDNFVNVKVEDAYIIDTNDKEDGKAGSATFNNDAKGSEGLKITKQVAGTAANTSDAFSFTLTLTNVSGNYSVTKTGEATGADLVTSGTYTFTLTDDDTITINNLPVGATYTIEETDDKDYDFTNVAVNGTITENTTTAKGDVSADDTISLNDVVFTNNKGFAPETGITMNTLPFVGIAAVAVAGGATLVISRKRRAGEEF